MPALTHYHFDLSHLDADRVYTFHKRGKVYPIRRHTDSSRQKAMATHPMFASLRPEQVSHFVESVETSPRDGVVIQYVTKRVLVDGPNGPNTQSYDQIVSYAISIPGADSPHNSYEHLAYALLFMHNNLLSLDNAGNFATPIFVFEQCIKPNAGNLVQQLSQMILTGESWISDPYPVMLNDTQHLVYPDIDPKTNEPSPLAGQWVYSQRLNSDALQPALSICLAAAVRAAKNAPELEGRSWSVQSAVLSSTYNAQQVTSPRPVAARQPRMRAALDSGNVKWTVRNLTPGSGLTVDASSLHVDMSKDTDIAGYQGQMTLQCTNHWLRHLSAYVQFLKYQGEGSNQTLVPISLGSSSDKTKNPKYPGSNPRARPPEYFYSNKTWKGDFVNTPLVGASGPSVGDLGIDLGFIEPSDSKKLLTWVSPTGTICGIPVPNAPTTLTIDYIPDDVNVIRVLWGGLGMGPYDEQVCALGITLTAVFELALPTILLMFDAATVDSVALTTSVWNHKGTMVNLALTVAKVVMNTKLSGETMAQQDAEAIGKFLAESLLPDLLQTGCAYGVILMAQIGAGMVMESIPFLDIASLIFNGLITVAQLTQTIVEVVESPFVFETEIARTFSLTLTINPDADMHEFPPEAIGGNYRVSIAYSNNSTPAVVEYQMPKTTASKPIHLTFSDLPAGGQIQVSVFMYSTTGWQAGQGQTAWSDAKGDGTGQDPTNKSIEVTVQNNAPPLDKFSLYQFVEKTVFKNGIRAWQGVNSNPPARQPVATQQTDTNITELNGLTISQDAGMLGYTFQTNASQFTAQNISLLENPQSAYAAATGVTVMPALAYERTGGLDGSGLNFYLDADPVSRPGGGAYLRRLSLVWTKTGGSQPPNMNPDPGMSWGQFPFPMDRLAALKGYVAGISYDAINHGKIYIVRVPEAPMPLAEAPKAHMISGPGTRVGLIALPRAITFGMLGQILVLEGGETPRIQAFDVNGNSFACFDPTDSGTKQAIAPLAQVTPETVFLDLAVEPRGYMYVLSYEGVGASPSDYHLDLYLPNGAFLARTNDFAAANIAVDIIRDVYALNYEVLENSPTLEPSVSLWIPPVKAYQGVVTAIQGTTIVLQDKHKKILNIATDSDTLFMINGQKGQLADIKVPNAITAYGSMQSNGTLNATQIFVPATTH